MQLRSQKPASLPQVTKWLQTGHEFYLKDTIGERIVHPAHLGTTLEEATFVSL